jgi:hypothetical protein
MACIPELRPRVLAVGDRLPYASLPERVALAQELRDIEAQMYRRAPVRKAPASATPMTPTLGKRIRHYAWVHPDMSVRQIAAVFNVSSGRVSEAVAGKRA